LPLDIVCPSYKISKARARSWRLVLLKKTTLVTSPPQFTVGPYGNVTKAPVTPQTGAGIATLIGVPGVPPGNVDLFAPRGAIDAGDAGIRVSGNVTLHALQILNAGNIQVQGTSVGIPVVQGPPVAALAAASNTAGAGVRSEGLPQPAASDSPSVIVVEFLGFGGDDNSLTPRQKSDGAKDKQSYDPTSSIQYVGAGQLSDQQRQKLTPEELSRLAIH
jgi:filamentous hemagglutinin